VPVDDGFHKTACFKPIQRQNQVLLKSPPHVMMDITPALGASAGIPQTIRQTTCLLAQSPYWSTSALIMSLHANGYADCYTKERRGPASLMDDAGYLDEVMAPHEKKSADLLHEVRRYFRRMIGGAYPLIAFSPGQFTDIIWKNYFAQGLPSQFRESLNKIRFYRSSLIRPEATMHLRNHLRPARLKTKGVDVLIFQNPTPIRVSHGTVKIIRLHDLVPLFRFDTQPKIQHFIHDFCFALSQCVQDSYFVCTSEPIREAFLSLYPHIRHRTSVIPVSVPMADWVLDPVSSQSAAPNSFFLTVGTIEPRKNYERLIRGFRLYREACSHKHRLIIVGSRGWRNEKEIRAIEVAQAEGWVTWHEQVAPEALAALYRQSIALVSASEDEGFGLPPLEAAALETPSVLSDLPVFRLHLGEAAEYFDSHDPKSLADALARMTPARRAELAPLARESTRPFRSENELAHWQELIREVTHAREIPLSSPVRVTSMRPRKVVSSRPLSIVIGCEAIDQRLGKCLDLIVPQAEAVNAEVLVGMREVAGDAKIRWPTVQFFHDPDGNILSLRAQGASMATGEVVAFTEDHGVVGPDWCQLMIECHCTHPETAIVYGPVQHDGPYGITSWANFLANFGQHMPPIEFSPRRRVPPIVNISIKRGYLLHEPLESGWFEFVGTPTLHDLGLCRYDNRLIVGHIQHHGLVGTYWAHFHNARVTTGTRKLPLGSARWKDQFINSLSVPVQLIGSDWCNLWARGWRRGLLLITLPGYVAIVFSHMLGEITGLFWGSGRSAEHLD
jgi:glycosyltransferase involved in cell wall biosynthesis